MVSHPVFLLIVFILEEAVRDEAVIFEGLGEDELVEEQDGEFRGVLGLFPVDVLEGGKPFLEILEKLAVEVGLFLRVAPQPWRRTSSKSN